MNMYSHLAWHETLDMHELVAFQTNGLIKLKRSIKEIKNPTLKNLYNQSIIALESNLRELLAFYPSAPKPITAEERAAKDEITGFFCG